MVQRKARTVALIFVVSSFLMFAVGMVLVSQTEAELIDQDGSIFEPTPTLSPAAQPTVVITSTLSPLHTTVAPSVVESSTAEVEETQIIATTFAATPTPTQTPVPTNQNEQGNNEVREEL
jgi:hypothetical protein